MTESKLTIIHNRAQCRLCGDIIESMSKHDWVSCRCGEIFVDGGRDYCRGGAKDFENFVNMYETREIFEEIDP